MSDTSAPAESSEPPVPAEWAEALAAAEREVAAQEAAERAAAERALLGGDAAPTTTSNGRGSMVFQAAAILVFAVSGVAAGLVFAPAHSSEEPDGAPHGESHSEHTAEHGPDPLLDGRHIDDLIREGAYAQALHLCRTLPRTAYGSDERLLTYREALCLEGLKSWPEARKAYKKAAEANPDLPVALWARGALGEARCALEEDDLETARDLLGRILLKSGDPACQGKRIREECLFLQCRLQVQELGPQSPLDPFDINAIAWPSFEAAIEHYLDWLPVEGAAQPEDHGNDHRPTLPKRPAAPAHHVAPARNDKHDDAPHAVEPKQDDHHAHEAKQKQDTHHDHGHAPEPAHASKPAEAPKPGWKAMLMSRVDMHLNLPERPLAEQFQAISTAAGLRLKLDPRLKDKLAGTTAAVSVEGVPLSLLLDSLTRKCSASWERRDGALVILPARPVDEQARIDVAVRTVQNVLRRVPDHPRIGAVRLTAANLDFISGRHQKAAKKYGEILDFSPHDGEAVRATYNLGLIELRNGNLPVARARFLEAADRGPGTKWEDFGWWWVGRSHLDGDDLLAARKVFFELSVAKTKSVACGATLALAACALLEGKDDAASDLLRPMRVFNRSAHTATADLFEALLQYRQSPTENRAKLLAEALRRARDGKLLGPAGIFLAGRIYREMDQQDTAVALYDAAADVMRGPLVMRMLFEAADWYDQSDKRAEARQRYQAIAAVDPERLGARAQLRMAELAAREGRGRECVSRCRTLVGHPEVEPTDLLAVMGRGYELMREYRKAADCFAGRVPPE
jgi:tetratricopeptide (TPR) repeat protein